MITVWHPRRWFDPQDVLSLNGRPPEPRRITTLLRDNLQVCNTAEGSSSRGIWSLQTHESVVYQCNKFVNDSGIVTTWLCICLGVANVAQKSPKQDKIYPVLVKGCMNTTKCIGSAVLVYVREDICFIQYWTFLLFSESLTSGVGKRCFIIFYLRFR